MRKDSGRNLECAARVQRAPLLAAATLVAWLPAAVLAQDAVPTPSGTGTPAYQSHDRLLELDEVRVQAYSLHERIVRAEDRFFRLYNELNRNDDYRVNCAYLPLEPGSRIENRVCMPAFHANAIVDAAVMPRCLVERAPDYLGSRNVDDVPPSSFCYTSPPPELVLLERSNGYAKNLRNVIRTDARLQEMAGELDDLYRQGTLIADRYHEIKTTGEAARATQPAFRPRIR